MLTPAPGSISLGVTPADVLSNIVVVDSTTGVPIVHVISADVIAGKVSRLAVEDGNLVREGDAFKVIDEERAIRIEWIVAPGEEPAVGDAVPDAALHAELLPGDLSDDRPEDAR